MNKGTVAVIKLSTDTKKYCNTVLTVCHIKMEGYNSKPGTSGIKTYIMYKTIMVFTMLKVI